MTLSVNPMAVVQAFATGGGSFNMMKLGGDTLVYKPVVDGKGLGMYKTYEGAMHSAASHIANNDALQGELLGAKSMIGGKATMFYDKSVYGSVVDQLQFNAGTTTGIPLIPTIVRAGQAIGAIIVSEGVEEAADWLSQRYVNKVWSVYLNGRLIVSVAAADLPHIIRGYRMRGLNVQVVKSHQNAGSRLVTKPRTRAHNVNF